MGSRLLSGDLDAHARVGVDTAPLVYFLEGDPSRKVVTRALLQQRGTVVVVSVLTEAELLVRPIRQDDAARMRMVESLLAGPNVRLVGVSREIARTAAEIRANDGLALPDAVIAATAIAEGCTALLGNDRTFQRLGDRVAYLHVDDLARKARGR